MKRVLILGAGLALGAMVSPAIADDIYLDFVGVGKYTNLTIYDSVLTGGNKYVSAGQLRYKLKDAPDGNVLYDGYFFCTDIENPAADGWADVKDLAEAPADGSGAMGDDRANMVGSLYKYFYDQSDDSSTKAAAFQVAIWEIVFEDDFDPTAAKNDYDGSKLDPTDGAGKGDFYTSHDTVSAQADTWLQAAWVYFKDGDWWNLYSGTSDDVQDIIMIPLPAPFALASVGLLGVLAGRRRLARLVR